MQTQIHEAPSPTTLGKSNHPAIFRISIPDGDSGNDLELHLAPLDSKNGDGLPADRVYVQASTERRWLEIAFRQFYAPLPWGWEPGLHWSVEAYERGMEQPPVGFCWVLDISPLLPLNASTRQISRSWKISESSTPTIDAAWLQHW